MKYFLVAGEASGDLHGSNLMKELKKEDPAAEFLFFGGDLMKAVGGTLIKHYREMAFMGFINVILNIRTIKRNMELCKKEMLRFNPDVIILIDYPGFNLRIAEFAKQNQIKVFYYISPKIWAWKEYRVKKIKEYVDEMFTILPFETDFYKKHNYEVNYVGNPLLDSVSDFRKNAQTKDDFLKTNGLDDRPIVALLAGSRVQEIKRILPVMLDSVEQFQEFQFVIAGVKTVDLELYKTILNGRNLKLIFDQTYDLLHFAHSALVASGTAALETALFDVPQIVLYQVEGGRIMDFIMWTFVMKTKWVSLPNIILGKEAIKELLQVNMTVKNITSEMKKMLFDESYRNKIENDYKRLHEIMGQPGSSQRAARKMIEKLNK